MTNGTAVAYDTPREGMESRTWNMVPRLKSIPWTRVAVDALLALGFLLAASSLLTVR